MKLCLLMNIFDESRPQVMRALEQVRQVYPRGDILVIYDGAAPFGLEGVREFVSTTRWKQPEHGGYWTHHYLDLFLKQSAAAYLIKIDPDTTALRPVEALPTTEAIFGRIREFHLGERTLRSVHGGALGFTRRMARRIVQEEWMLAEHFQQSRYRNFHDRMLCDVIVEQQLPLVPRLDFACGAPADHQSTFSHP